MKIRYRKHRLNFKRPAGTSRSVLKYNDIYYLKLEREGRVGRGECNPLQGLAIDDRSDFEQILIEKISEFQTKEKIELESLEDYPSMKFGFEMALKDLENAEDYILFPSEFSHSNASMPINGLLWMGSKEYMLEQLKEKLEAGFSCIKMKIGAIDFEQEIDVLKAIRKKYSKGDIEIRVDANGAFTADEALKKLEAISAYDIHSIEQPIAVGQWQKMAELVNASPIPIALDEELISIREHAKREELLDRIKPDYIILKPSLIGGFEDSDHWISIAENRGIAWWITSALESNIGLNAIAQYAFIKENALPQGLGTGSLFTNNIHSPLFIDKGRIYYNSKGNWGDDFGI